MATINQTKYGVANRLAALETSVTELRAENNALRAWVLAELGSKINDSHNVIQSAVACDFRELQASIRIPRDGADGKDGQSIVGPQGPRGDCTIPNDSEVASALLALRRNHARVLAKVKYELELAGKQNRGIDAVLKAVLQAIERDLERGVQ
jgi:hypothetical protein